MTDHREYDPRDDAIKSYYFAIAKLKELGIPYPVRPSPEPAKENAQW